MAVWLDVTTSLGWMRPVTGVVRVEVECARDFLGQDPGQIKFCRYAHGLRVVLCCHDIIPVVRPDLTLGRITARFREHLKQMVAVADHIVCVSNHTCQDLKRFLSSTETERVPRLSQIRHGSDLPQSNRPVAVSPEVDEILEHPFVLYVSTLEKRKNHGLLLDAYEELIKEGGLALPILVLVGMAGWGADPMVARLERLASQGAPIRWLRHVTDSDLNLLYRHCLMTVYPSLYEGWGLPVAESLAYGKFCLASSAASIPEVGGDLVDYLAPDDFRAWSRALRHYFLKPDLIGLREKAIVSGYRPPAWSQTAGVILGVATELESSP